MAKNAIQFQAGLSLPDFLARYGSEEQCRQALVEMRWPEGFECPLCGGRRHSYHTTRQLFQCTDCKRQTSIKAGTILHKSRLPLTTWFVAIYLLTQSKNDIAALELKRQLGIGYDAAWGLKKKLLAAMQNRNQGRKLSGAVQIDDAYLGGEKPGKRGQDPEDRVPAIRSLSSPPSPPLRDGHATRNCGWCADSQSARSNVGRRSDSRFAVEPASLDKSTAIGRDGPDRHYAAAQHDGRYWAYGSPFLLRIENGLPGGETGPGAKGHYQEFRVRSGILGAKEPPDAATQTTQDP